MAFSKGNVSSEGGEIKRYIGVGSVFVKAINPTKAQLAELYGRDQDNDPQYLGELDIEGTKVPYVRIDFLIQTDPEKCNGIDTLQRMSFLVRKQERWNKENTKVQVIDSYGRTAWVTNEQLAAHEIPQYSNGPANISADYRAAYYGEEQLTNFVKAYLNIPNVMKYVNNKWELIDHPEEAESRLDHIADYFNGNFEELQTLLNYQPNNKVKVLFGVRTTDENKQYQAFYTEMVLKNGVSDYARLDKDLQERKANGAYPSTEFEVCPLREYVNTPSEVETPSNTPAQPAAWFKKN